MPSARAVALSSCVVLALAFASGLARADAISGPPACPEGSRGVSSHAGTWCVPHPCDAAPPCGEHERCAPWRVCTRVADVPPGGLGGFNRPPVETTIVVGTCAPGRACRGDEEPPPPTAGTFRPGPATCTDATYCIPQALAPFPSTAAAPTQGTASPGSPPSSSSTPATAGTSGGAGGGGGCGCGASGRAGAMSLVLGAVAAAFLARRRR